MLRKAFGYQTMAQKTFVSGTTSSKRAKNALKTDEGLVPKIKDLVLGNRRFTTRDLAVSVGL